VPIEKPKQQAINNPRDGDQWEKAGRIRRVESFKRWAGVLCVGYTVVTSLNSGNTRYHPTYETFKRYTKNAKYLGNVHDGAQNYENPF
jgi:hypothetical protein